MQIPQDAFLLLFVATGAKDNAFKDYNTIHKALEFVTNRWKGRQLLFMAVGGDSGTFKIGNTEVIFVPYISSIDRLVKYYQAADIYLHATHADTYPNVILEALACGTPVIATGVGGIPEQIDDGHTGFITPIADPEFMATCIIKLLENDDLRKSMEISAARAATLYFDADIMAENYLNYYSEVIQDWQSGPGNNDE